MHQASRNPVHVISEYEDFKREFRAQGDTESTERQCANQGFRFVPMALEAHSGGCHSQSIVSNKSRFLKGFQPSNRPAAIYFPPKGKRAGDLEAGDRHHGG